MKKQEGFEIRAWFCEFDHGSQLAHYLDRQAPKTGEWFLKSPEFNSWLEGTGQTLFCEGIPGAGKSVIAAIVIEHLCRTFVGDSSVGLAFAFLNYQDELPLPKLFSLLLKQLIPESVPMMVRDLYTYHRRNCSHLRLDEILSTLRGLVSSYPKTFIVIDALDERKVIDGDRQRILTELFKLQDAVGTNLLLTGRSISDIAAAFQRRKSMLYEIRARDDDVLRFITNELETFEGCILDAPDLKKRVSDAVINATDGMFLLAYLHLEALRDQTSARGIENAVERLPKGSMAYYQAYDAILRRINDQSPDRRRLANKVLSWITVSKRPIRLAELRHALSVTEDAVDVDEANMRSNRLIVLACAGLVTIDEPRDTIQLVHYTTAEYLQQRWMLWFPNANGYIATVSMNYLKFERFSIPIMSENWEEYHTRLRTNFLYEYAALYWGDHAREAYPQVKHLVAKFLRSGPKLLDSVHVLDALPLPFPFPRRVDGVTGLHVAAYFGIVEQLEELIQEGEDSKAVDSHGRNALHWAARNGQRQAVEFLVSQGLDVNVLDAQKESPLHYSARQANTALVELLIHLGSLVETRNSAGETALLVAARSVDIGALEALLTSGADPNATDRMDRNALHLAITASKSNSATAVKLLLAYGVNFCFCDGDNMMPLHYAVAEGSNEIIDLLLESGANINLGVQRNTMGTKEAVSGARSQRLRDGIGLTPLHFAACSGHSQMTKYLLKKGANPNARCCYGETPLHIAIRGRLFKSRSKATSAPYPLLSDDPWTDSRWHVDIVYERDIDYESKELVEANRYVQNERLAVVTALLRSPIIDLNAQNIHLDCPLHMVKHDSDISAAIVAKLLGLGVDISACNDQGQTALSLACEAGALSVVTALLKHGDNPYWTSPVGLNLAHLAVQHYGCETGVLEALSDYGLDLSLKDSSGKGILHHVAIGGSLDIQLLSFLHGRNLIDLYATDVDGKTPLDYADAQAKKKGLSGLPCGSRWNETLKKLQILADMESVD